jgi:hypothetical protein
MNLAFIFVIGFVSILVFLAFVNSRKVSRQLKELINKKK